MHRPLAVLVAVATAVLAISVPTLAQAPLRLPPADQVAAFTAAGFKRAGGQWKACGDPGTASYSPGAIEEVRDINGDGRPDAVISEGSTFCFGMTGMGFALVSKQANGAWTLVTKSAGIPTFLPRARNAVGWPDLEIGGPGFCFPVHRWNGRAYALHRHQYEGKPCRPGG